ncbi:MAG: ABC transporter permease subunit [Deltaproteobacteria bacterium]|nr:ABC transporter permease subunit [Deltaproteobacteria bacterium]
MKMPKELSSIINIAKYTIADEVSQRSFIVMFVISVIFVFLIRGCYQGNYMVNGQELEAAALVGTVSKITFHIIAVVVMLIAALLSMRVFKRDRDEGMQSCIFSKPITRKQYVTGKILGLWALSSFFMFILHAIIFLTVFIKLNVVMPGYLAASMLCSFNLLFVVIAVLLLSLIMPDIAAFLCVMGISIISFVADGVFAISHSPMAQAMMRQQGPHSDLTGWNIVYYLWPKLSGTQHFASSFINGEGILEFMQVYPLINIIIYCFVFGAVLFWHFRNEDII